MSETERKGNLAEVSKRKRERARAKRRVKDSERYMSSKDLFSFQVFEGDQSRSVCSRFNGNW